MKNRRKSKLYKDLRFGNVLIHPIRYQIIKAIEEKHKLYIKELAEVLEINRRKISFHLSILKQYGFVEGGYEVIDNRKGKAAKYFRITPVDEVLCTIVERIREIT